MQYREFGDPEILTRIAQYEMAYRRQSSVRRAHGLRAEDITKTRKYENTKSDRGLAADCFVARVTEGRDH